MPIDETKCCNTHTEEKENLGTCCQTKGEEEKNYESSKWFLGKHNNEISTMRQKQKAEQDTYEYHIKIGPEPKSVSHLLQEGMELQRRLEDE